MKFESEKNFIFILTKFLLKCIILKPTDFNFYLYCGDVMVSTGDRWHLVSEPGGSPSRQ